jgi:hypothetical protein
LRREFPCGDKSDNHKLVKSTIGRAFARPLSNSRQAYPLRAVFFGRESGSKKLKGDARTLIAGFFRAVEADIAVAGVQRS